MSLVSASIFVLVLSSPFHPLALASPLRAIQTDPRSANQLENVFYVSPHRLFPVLSYSEHSTKSADCPGELPQDVTEYPRGINMRPTHKLDSGLIIAIEFDNGAFPVEIWDVEGLCAGALPIRHLPVHIVR